MNSATAPRARRRASTFRRVGWLAVALLITMSLAGPGASGVAAADPACGLMPLDVEIILDNSGSMSENNAGPGGSDQDRAGWAKAAIDGLVADLGANGGIGTGPATSTGGRHRVGLTKYNGDTATVLSSLGSSATLAVPTSGSGNTPFKQGMAAGAADMTANDRTTDFGLEVRQVIIFLSDGRPWPDTAARRPNATEIGAFQDAADEVFSIAIGFGGSTDATAVDLALMQLLDNPDTGAYPTPGAHYANVLSESDLSAFFASIFKTIACTGSLQIDKTITAGTNFPGGTFDFSVDCAPGGTFTASITLAAAATTGSTTVSGIADGASCTVSEKTPLPPAGAGYVWGTPVITGNPAVIVSGQTATVAVSNPRTFSSAPAISLTKSATPPTYDAVGDVINYTFLLTNTGNVTLVAPFTVTDDKTTNEACPATPTSLAPDASILCTASYTIAQADLDSGSVKNVATGHGFFGTAPVNSNADDETVTAVQSPALTLLKTATPPTYNAVGADIDYTYKLTNSGNVTLAGPFTVTDDKATVACPATPTSLAPGLFLTCTASYTITQADLNSGSVKNVAQGQGFFDGKAVDSNEDDETVTAVQNEGLALVKTATPQTYSAAGQVIGYSYLVTNTGNVSLAGPVSIADDKSTDETCPAVSTVGNKDGLLDPGESITCSATYTITQADMNSRQVTNIATAKAGGKTSNQDSETVTAPRPPTCVDLGNCPTPTPTPVVDPHAHAGRDPHADPRRDAHANRRGRSGHRHPTGDPAADRHAPDGRDAQWRQPRDRVPRDRRPPRHHQVPHPGHPGEGSPPPLGRPLPRRPRDGGEAGTFGSRLHRFLGECAPP